MTTLPAAATGPTPWSIETVVAPVELHVNVELPLGAIVAGLADNVTDAWVGCGAAAGPLPHPEDTIRANKHKTNMPQQRAILIEDSFQIGKSPKLPARVARQKTVSRNRCPISAVVGRCGS